MRRQDWSEVAGSVGPEGRIDVLDVQQEMLDAKSGRLPYEDASFDAAYVVTVLGEISDREQALAKLRRILKPGGRPLLRGST